MSALKITAGTAADRTPAAHTNGAVPVTPTTDEILETDLGNAQRLAQRHGQDVRYSFPQARWFHWDGRRLKRDDTGEVFRRAKDTAVSIFQEAAIAATAERSKELGKHAIRTQAEARLAAMVTLARSEPGIPVEMHELDADHYLLNLDNGTLDLRTGELRPHRREDMITRLAPVTYDPAAKCPRFLAFLDRIFDGDDELLRFVQKAVGYSLTGDVSEQVIIILYGPGMNGKSTLLMVMLTVLGDYAKQAAPGLLLARRNDRHPTEQADLVGARFVTSVEADEGQRLAEAFVKAATGGDRMKARRMREDFFEWCPTHKLWLAVNHKPRVIGTDHAIWRRIRLIPFNVTIPEDDRDKHLLDKLIAEAPGILNWALAGCTAWQSEGLDPPDAIRSATDDYRAEQDTLAAFIEDCCVTGAAKKAKSKDVYAAYRHWCQESGEDPLPQKTFGTRLTERGFPPDRSGHGGHRARLGIGLVTHPELISDTG